MESTYPLPLMDLETRQRFRTLIEARLTELEQQLEARGADAAAIEPDKAIGRLSRLDSMQMQQMSRDAQRRQQAELYRLKDALSRLDRDAYGKCQLCGQPIALERLEIQLDAVFCIRCAG